MHPCTRRTPQQRCFMFQFCSHPSMRTRCLHVRVCVQPLLHVTSNDSAHARSACSSRHGAASFFMHHHGGRHRAVIEGRTFHVHNTLCMRVVIASSCACARRTLARSECASNRSAAHANAAGERAAAARCDVPTCSVQLRTRCASHSHSLTWRAGNQCGVMRCMPCGRSVVAHARQQ